MILGRLFSYCLQSRTRLVSNENNQVVRVSRLYGRSDIQGEGRTAAIMIAEVIPINVYFCMIIYSAKIQ